MKTILKNSHWLIIAGFVLGAALGLILNKEIMLLKLIGDIFVRLIKISVVPLVFIAVTNSILNISGEKTATRLIPFVLSFFVISTTVSVAIGMLNAILIRPGGSDILLTGEKFSVATPPTFSEFVLNLIPTNPLSSLVEANTFHIIILAVIIGSMIVVIGRDKLKTTVSLINDCNDIVMHYIKTIITIAPVGVFALTATSFAAFGQSMITNLLKYVITITISVLIIYSLYFLVLAVMTKGRTKDTLKGLTKIWAVAASTSSSAATLPVSMHTCDELHINKDISRFVLPFGVTMNMNGAAQFMAVTFIFIAQVYGVSLSFGALMIAVLMITILVMAMPGIPGGAMVPMTVVLAAFNIPVEGFAIVLGVYSMIDMLDTTLNVTGDVICTLATDKFSKKI